ncbi:MAG: methionyl-tRNA formyltransferase [Kineosporiaceae bacterium]
MRLVVAGTPDVALPSLDALDASPHEIVGVLTRPDAVAGRGRKASRSPVARWADERGLPVLQPPRLGAPEALADLAALRPDCCPVIAYGQLVPPAALALPPRGWANLHFSVLPAWRGAAPVQQAIIAGDEVTGASVFRLEEGLDTGPVYGVLTETIRPTDTAGELLGRLAVAGAQLLVQVLDALGEDRLAPVAQPADGVSHAPKLTPEDARVRWDVPAFAVDRRVRGCTPAPGAWTTFRDERLGLGPVTPLPQEPGDEPGTLHVSKAAVEVSTAAGRVRLGTVRPAGKREMAAADWARGVRIAAGEVLA